jgi:hypothetical protein
VVQHQRGLRHDESFAGYSSTESVTVGPLEPCYGLEERLHLTHVSTRTLNSGNVFISYRLMRQGVTA